MPEMCAEARHSIGLTQFSGPIKKAVLLPIRDASSSGRTLRSKAGAMPSGMQVNKGQRHDGHPFTSRGKLGRCVHREPRCVLGPASDRQPWLLACLVSEITKCAKTASSVRALLPPGKGRAHRKLMTRYTSSEGLHRKIPGPACEMLHPFGHALHCLHATIFYLHAIRYQTRKIHKMPKNPAKIPHDPSDAQKKSHLNARKMPKNPLWSAQEA